MSASAEATAASVIEIAQATLRELQQQPLAQITLDSTLDHDLGLDSLARAELFTRIEQRLRVQLPDALFEQARTLRDIAAALGVAQPTSAPPPAARRRRQQDLACAPPQEFPTLTQVLTWHCERHPDFRQITICDDGVQQTLTYEQLWHAAQDIAAGLQRAGIQAATTVALMLPTGGDYFCTFCAVLVAGAIPVPLYPPGRASQLEEHVRRHAAILANCGASLLVTTEPLRKIASVLRLHTPTLHRITTSEELRAAPGKLMPVHADSSATALLQYTSGSTGAPKGVVLSHRNVLANIRALGIALQIRRDDLFVSWLPLYHDMGLIGAWLGTFYFGLPLVIMSPLSFLTRPLRWLQAIDQYRGTLSAAPNFAYELCLKRASDTELEQLDLSCWRIAMNGAEAVLPQTLQRFYERLAGCGLHRSALTPVYGLAECSVGLTTPPVARGPLIDTIDRERFMREGIASPVTAQTLNAVQFVSCGLPLPDHQVRIVDEAGRPLGERQEGRLEFRGPSATCGYFRNQQATDQLLRDGWLDSGDRAYLAGAELYVTGRIKDIIIRAGRHIYPEELEAAVGAVPGIRKGCVAVFGDTDAATGTERVVVFAETPIQAQQQREALRQAVIAAVVQLIGEPPDEVVLAAPHAVLKTSSGKIRRAATAQLYRCGEYPRSASATAWSQILRLSLSAIRPGLQRTARRARELAYGGYFWVVAGLIGILAAALMLVPLAPRTLWAISHHTARIFLALSGIAFEIQGGEHLQQARGIIVVNHSSYLDGLFLLAAIQKPCRFVAKRELQHWPLAGTFLRRLDTLFVERFQARTSVEDAKRLAELAAHGAPCIYFPEGTFTAAPGLMPFHLGAFAAAVRANLPVLPVTLLGTRALLPDGRWLPHRKAVCMHVAAPLEPSRTMPEFRASVALRDAARQAMQRHFADLDPLA